MRHQVARTRAHRREGGAAAVEFGLVLLPLMTLLLGLVQYGWYFYASHSASAAAREGARRVIVGDCWDKPTQLLPYVRAQAPMVSAVDYSPSNLGASDVEVGELVTVTVKIAAAQGDIIGFVPVPNGGAIEQTFAARLEDKTSGSVPCP